MRAPVERTLALTPSPRAATDPTLGAVKTLLHRFLYSPRDASGDSVATNLRAAYRLVCAHARQYGVDPDQVLEQHRAASGTHPRLVALTDSGASTRVRRNPIG